MIAPAPAAAAPACTPEDGVLVVVDFGELGGVRRGCAPGDPKSGLKALHAAGFSTAGTQRYGPSFVCRIDGKPGKSREKCVDTPPGDAHWAYWHAGRSGWTQSSTAVTSYDPEPGTIDGWSFGDGDPPRTPVAAARSDSQDTPAASASTSATPRPARAGATEQANAGGSGGGFPTVIAILVIVAAGIVAAVLAWRRRQRGTP